MNDDTWAERLVVRVTNLALVVVGIAVAEALLATAALGQEEATTTTAEFDLIAKVKYYADLAEKLVMALVVVVAGLATAVLLLRDKIKVLRDAVRALVASTAPVLEKLERQDPATLRQTKSAMKAITHDFGVEAAKVVEAEVHKQREEGSKSQEIRRV